MTTQNEDRQRLYGPALPTSQEAKEAGRSGYGLQCEMCGGYGAVVLEGARPGPPFPKKDLVLCHPEATAFLEMKARHCNDLAPYRNPPFSQETR